MAHLCLIQYRVKYLDADFMLAGRISFKSFIFRAVCCASKSSRPIQPELVMEIYISLLVTTETLPAIGS